MRFFLAIALVICLAGMSQTHVHKKDQYLITQVPTPTTPTLQKIQDGAKCVYGIVGLFIDSLDLAQVYQTGGASLISERVKNLFTQILELPEKFATDPQSAAFEAYSIFSKAKSLKDEFFTYLPKCSKFIGYATSQ